MKKHMTISLRRLWPMRTMALLPICIFFGRLTMVAAAGSSDLKAHQKPIEISDDEEFWCYSCRTDYSRVKDGKVRTVIEGTLSGSVNIAVVNENCDGRGNVTLINSEPCPVRACLKFLVDDKKGVPFVMRGCASTFFKMSASEFAEQHNAPHLVKKLSTCEVMPSEWRFETCLCQNSLCNDADRSSPSNLFFCILSSVIVLLFAN